MENNTKNAEQISNEFRTRSCSYPSPPDIKEFRKIMEIKKPTINLLEKILIQKYQ